MKDKLLVEEVEGISLEEEVVDMFDKFRKLFEEEVEDKLLEEGK